MALLPRLVGAAGLIALLTVLYLALGDLYAVPIAVILVALPILQWTVFRFFYRRSREHPDNIVLRVRAQDALSLALAQSVGAVLGGIVLLRLIKAVPQPGPGVFSVGLSFLACMIAAPALNAFVTWGPWRSPRLEEKEEAVT